MTIVEQLHSMLMTSPPSVTLFFTGIILLSYVLEDLAIATAASLASQEHIPPTIALLAIFIGISTGDLGLYYLGKLTRYSRPLRYRALTNKHFRAIRKKLHQQPILNLFLIRFIPGLRTIGFTLSGFFTLPLPLFLTAVISATALWTGIVFSIIYTLGTSTWAQATEYQWAMIPIAFGFLLMTNKFISGSYSKGRS